MILTSRMIQIQIAASLTWHQSGDVDVGVVEVEVVAGQQAPVHVVEEGREGGEVLQLLPLLPSLSVQR
jgi:hypothetical protein